MSNCNGLLYIFDREEKLLSILNNEAFESDIFFDDEFKKELNGEWSYKFSVDMSKTKDLMLEYNKVGFYDRRGNFQLFIIHDIEDNIGYEAIRTVYCLHDFQSLNEDIIEEGKVIGNARKALETTLKDSAYSVGVVSNTEEQVKNISMITKLEAINSIAETYGLEVYYRLELDETKTKIAKRYVDLVEMLGEDTGLSFDFSLNIESIKRKINNNFFTVLYGRGKQLKDESYANFSEAEWTKGSNPTNKPKGQSWVSDEDAIAKYGVRKGIYSNQNISSSGTLLKRTWEKLQKVNRPKINYEASVYELSSIAGYEDLKINLGDRFNIIDDKYNINEAVRVIAEYESILDETSKKVELGDPVSCFTDDPESDDSYIDIEDDENAGEGGEGGSDEVEGEDTLPNVPVVTAEGYFATVSVSWTFENKSYYTYELYASDVKGFEPTEENKIFEGKASAFLHEVEPMEIWYYKARAKNGYGNYTDFSEEVSAETLKITDGTKYFESAAIKDALIGELRLDRGWVGQLTGTHIDAKNLTVTDGNGKKTLDIDSYGNVRIDAIGFKMDGENVDLSQVVTVTDLKTGGATVINGDNVVTGSVSGSRIKGGVIEGATLKTAAPTSTGGIWIKENSMQLGSTSLYYSNDNFKIEAEKNISISSSGDLYLMPKTYVNVSGRLHSNQLTLGDGTSAYIKNSTFYSQWANGNLSTWGTRLNGAVILGTDSGNIHVVNSSGGKGGIYATMYSSYSLAQETDEQLEEVKAMDIIESATVMNECVIPIMPYSVSNDSMGKYISYNEESQMYDMNINNTISLLWRSIQELKEENKELRQIIESR